MTSAARKRSISLSLTSGQYQHVDFELNPAATISLMVKNKGGKGIPPGAGLQDHTRTIATMCGGGCPGRELTNC
jgi:hypothetical protein